MIGLEFIKLFVATGEGESIMVYIPCRATPSKDEFMRELRGFVDHLNAFVVIRLATDDDEVVSWPSTRRTRKKKRRTKYCSVSGGAS